MPFLGPALGYLTAMCSPGWGNLVAFDWNDLPVGRELDGKFLKTVKSPPHAPPSPLPSPHRLYIDRCISHVGLGSPFTTSLHKDMLLVKISSYLSDRREKKETDVKYVETCNLQKVWDSSDSPEWK